MDAEIITYLLITGFIGLVLLAAQLKQFDIANELKRIREILEENQGPGPNLS